MHFFDWWQFCRCKISKLLSTTSGEPFDKETSLKNPSLFLLQCEWNFFWLPAKSLHIKCENYPLPVQETHWRDRVFQSIFFVFGTYSDFEQSFFDIGTKFSVKLSKLLCMRSDETFDGIEFFLDVLLFICGLWAKHFLTFGKKLIER